MEKWVLIRKGAPFEEIAAKFQIHPVIARLIRNRDVIGDADIDAYLNGTISDLHDGILMKDMHKAVDILLEKIAEKKKIRIIGDYDIDGINATYILLEGLHALGADVDSDIPDRMKEGYGLNRVLVERAYEAGVDTIITCDNGIAAFEEIQYGKSLGMTIVVTDHHEVPYEEVSGTRQYILPPADAVVDPKQEDCEYPFKGLCGAAVAYKLVEAMFEVSGKDVEDIDYLLENVAIATVGDVMDLIGENRIFVKQGLDMLKRTKSKGLKALIDCNKISVESLNTYHIGFRIGPCLNASGRLDTAKRALELLRAKTKGEADILAGDLKALNDSRKEMTVQAIEDAVEQIEGSSLKNDKVLVVFLPDCHESLAGIVAGRIREKYYHPTIVLTRTEDGLKGSGRSTEAYHMYEELNRCKHLLTKFGGHKLAAGVSLKEENLEKFRTLLNVNTTLTEDDMIPKVLIDMQLPIEYIDENLIGQLESLEPFGKGNQQPLFAEKDLEILNARVCGQNQNTVRMRVRSKQGRMMDAVYFGDAARFLAYFEEKGSKMADFTYHPSVNEFNGRKNLQITVQNYR